MSLNTKFVILWWGRLAPLHFSSKDFDILDLDPPNNPTSHYGACHFVYNVALNYVGCGQAKTENNIWFDLVQSIKSILF